MYSYTIYTKYSWSMLMINSPTLNTSTIYQPHIFYKDTMLYIMCPDVILPVLSPKV